MSKHNSIVNILGDHEETLIQYSRHLGTDIIRRQIFNTIYGRAKLPKTRKQIMLNAGIDQAKSQQAQNALDSLYKYKLITRFDNNGIVQDGCRYLYGKDETVRANKNKIIQLADNPKKAEKIPTKRSVGTKSFMTVRSVSMSKLKKRKHLTVLYLTANPEAHPPLRLDNEVKRVKDSIRGSKFRDNVSIEYCPAANLKVLIDGLNDHKPQVVHFSGHSGDQSLAMDEGEFSGDAASSLPYQLLGNALEATDTPPKVVVLNSCDSASAKEFLLPKIDILIAMSSRISDIAASVFAPHFYAALASGQSVKSSFEQGRLLVEHVSLIDKDTPTLFNSSDIDPSSLVLT